MPVDVTSLRTLQIGDQGVAAGAVTEEAEARAEDAGRDEGRPQVPRRLAGSSPTVQVAFFFLLITLQPRVE